MKSIYLLVTLSRRTEGRACEPPKKYFSPGCLGALDGNVPTQKMAAGRDCRLPVMARASVGARTSPYGVCGGRMGIGTDVSTGTSVNDCQYEATVLRADLQLRRKPLSTECLASDP